MTLFLDKVAKLLVILIFFSVTLMLIELADQSEMTILASSSIEQRQHVVPASDAYPPPLPTKALLTPYPPPNSPTPPSSYPSPTTPPTASPIPTATPTLPPLNAIEPDTRQVMAWLDYRSSEPLGEHKVIVDTHSDRALVKTIPRVKQFRGELKLNEEYIEKEKEHKASMTGEWEVLVSEGFEGPSSVSNPCSLHDASDDRFERYWGADSLRAFNGSSFAAHPAKGGVDGISPAEESYPPNLDSWLLCGPFAIDEAERLMVEFAYLPEKDKDNDDYLFFGVSTDGESFQGSQWYTHQRQWIVRLEEIRGVQGQMVWLGWAFQSDEDDMRGEGAWIDDINVWRIGTPIFTGPEGEGFECNDLGGQAEKGLVLSPQDPNNPEYPIIRPDGPPIIERLTEINTQWVRLEFRRDLFDENNKFDQKYSTMYKNYDFMVNQLCANQIRVLGLLNHEILDRQDYNKPETASDYQYNFSNKSAAIAFYFRTRIRYWEIWNEPDFPGGASIDAPLYKPLLTKTYNAITAYVPKAQILSAGLSTAWDGSFDYFEEAYDSDNGATPFRFDYFAIHPYPDFDHSNNPAIYMYDTDDDDYNTIFDRFLKKIREEEGEDKNVWITEIGWNSSKGSPTRPLCHEPLLVNRSEQSRYLLDSFDILFKKVKRWGDSEPAVDKVIWYQYMDVGDEIERICPTPTPGASTNKAIRYHPVDSSTMRINPDGSLLPGQVDWSYGLYDGNQERKESACSFEHYPRRACSQYFPIIQDHIPIQTKR